MILVVLGLGESDASIAKSADINVNLYAGLGMLVMSVLLHRVGADAAAVGEPDEESERRAAGPGATADDAVGARAAGG